MIISILVYVLLAVAVVVSTIAGIWLLIEAFRVHVLWGLALIFFPILGIVFVIMHWDTARKPFLLNLLSLLIFLAAFLPALFRNIPAAASDSPAAPAAESLSPAKIIADVKQAATDRKARAEIAARGFLGKSLADVELEFGPPQGKLTADGVTEYRYTSRGLILISTNGLTVTDEIRQ